MLSGLGWGANEKDEYENKNVLEKQWIKDND